MTWFLLVETQVGEGCDYTIGCGLSVWTTQAESYEALVASITEAIERQGDPDTDPFLEAIIAEDAAKRERVKVYELAHDARGVRELDLAAHRAHIVERGTRHRRAQFEEMAEREQLAKLKEKYES